MVWVMSDMDDIEGMWTFQDSQPAIISSPAARISISAVYIVIYPQPILLIIYKKTANNLFNVV